MGKPMVFGEAEPDLTGPGDIGSQVTGGLSLERMSRKRTLIPDVYKNRKRICMGPGSEEGAGSSNWYPTLPCNGQLLSDTKAALIYLRNLFPREKFEGRLPAMVLKHQLYSIIKSRTLVDKELNDMKISGEVRIFKLGAEEDEFCILLMDDYRSHVCVHSAQLGINMATIDKFLSSVLVQCQDTCLSKAAVMGDFQFQDEEITQLEKASVLSVRDGDSWWVTIPGAGIFMKTYTRGRKAVLTMIRKCKYKEILKKDLEARKLPKVARLGMQYHIHDIIGSQQVQCIDTSAGQLLRLSDT